MTSPQCRTTAIEAFFQGAAGGVSGCPGANLFALAGSEPTCRAPKWLTAAGDNTRNQKPPVRQSERVASLYSWLEPVVWTAETRQPPPCHPYGKPPLWRNEDDEMAGSCPYTLLLTALAGTVIQIVVPVSIHHGWDMLEDYLVENLPAASLRHVWV